MALRGTSKTFPGAAASVPSKLRICRYLSPLFFFWLGFYISHLSGRQKFSRWERFPFHIGWLAVTDRFIWSLQWIALNSFLHQVKANFTPTNSPLFCLTCPIFCPNKSGDLHPPLFCCQAQCPLCPISYSSLLKALCKAPPPTAGSKIDPTAPVTICDCLDVCL